MHQSAYKKQHSTETAILKILNDVGQNADTKRATLLIGLDLSAAFDTIVLSILFKRLQLSYCLHGQALNWVISYLEGRNQYIKFGDSCSDQIPVTDGVPQGSVLGPLLFSLNISPVADVIGSFGMSHHRYADNSAVVVACGIVGSRLDYCNSLLCGTSADNLSRLQRMQNTLARVVAKSGWGAHSLPILERLHWLPVEHRIRFKIATLTFRSLHQNNPPYLHDLISRYTSARTLRSTDKYLLSTKRTNTKIGSRAFSAAASETWNAPPTDIKLTDSLNKFKIDLKTHLFRIAFTWSRDIFPRLRFGCLTWSIGQLMACYKWSYLLTYLKKGICFPHRESASWNFPAKIKNSLLPENICHSISNNPGLTFSAGRS